MLLACTSAAGSSHEITFVKPTPRAQAVSLREWFPLGIFKDASMTHQPEQFAAMSDTLAACGLNTVMFVNTFTERDAPLLDVADQRGFNVLMSPGGDWNESWWPDAITPTRALAHAAAQPVVDRRSAHRSFRGYIVSDEPALPDREKLALLTQALHECDPAHLAMPDLIGTARIGLLFRASAPDVMVLDI